MSYKLLIGDENVTEQFEIEKGAIRSFAHAIGDKNPLYYDEAYAKAKGYKSIVAPLTFPTTFRGQIPKWFQDLDRNLLLHGEQVYQYKRRLCAGETITLTDKVIDVYEKQSKNGKLTFIVRERKGFDISNNEIFKEQMTLIIRGE